MSPPLRETFQNLFGVWRDTRQIVLVAQTAAIYAAVLIPFKVGIPLIPGFAELRPANALPIVASLLFGPVAAWGAGFGNIIGDCFGTLGPASLFGFLGNFAYGYVPYVLWGRLGFLSSGLSPVPRSWRQALEFVVICLAASLACAVIIAWGVDLLGLVPFKILAIAIFANNFVMALLLAPPLLVFLYPRVTRWGLRYEDIRTSLRQGANGERQWEDAPLPLLIHQSSPSPFLHVRSASFTYQGSQSAALNGVTLSVHRGESLAVMGPSGSGKSTLCYALNGLIPHQISGRWSGQVMVNGVDTRSQSVWQQAGTVGLLFQDFEAQLVSTNIEMELTFPLEHMVDGAQPPTSSDLRRRVAQTLDRVGLSGLERRDPLSLSGGQRQRLVIGSILIREPALIALDEPLTDLDPEGRRALDTLLTNLRQTGAALLVAEHDSEEAIHADRVCVLNEGKVAWEGTPRELFGRPDQEELTKQLGISPLPLAACFTDLGLTQLPILLEEAWEVAGELGLTVLPFDSAATQAAGQPPSFSSPLARARVVVDVQQVSYEYETGRPALTEANLTVRQGEFVAILGRNGSGKSTLANLINGLRTPTMGRILVEGHDTTSLTPGQLAAAVGHVFQNPDHQIFSETVETEVSFGARNLGCGPDECERRVTAALDAVGLNTPAIRCRDPFSLTKGDRQRVAVASVLAARPGILIFDEPTTGLDARETTRMLDMLKRLNNEGHTILMITHSLSLVAAYARRCVIVRDGQIQADGSTRQIFAHLSKPEVSDLTGLQVPELTRFTTRWGQTLLTVEEVKAALKKP